MLRKSLLVVFLVVAVAVAGAGAAGAQTLTVAQGADPVSLDPHGENDQPSARVRVQIFETLVNHGYDLEIVPGLAKSWRQLDEVTWEFKLQDNVRFHNGDPFTAADVKYSFERIKELPSPAAFLLDSVEEVVVVDAYTVKIVLSEPFAPILAHLAHPSNAIVNRRSVEEAGDDFGSQVAVGTGPFVFEDWVAGSHVTLIRNEEYWGEPAKAERLVIRGIPENTVRAIELETGGVDIAYNIDPMDELRLSGTPGLVLDKYETLSTSYIGFNVEKAPFDDVRVRQAINHALDVEAVVDYIYTGQASPAGGPLPPLVWGALEMEGYEYNPEKAKELLAEAGYPDGFSTTLWTNDNAQRMQIAEMFQADLAEVGIDVEVLIVPWSTYLEETGNGKHDMFILGWVTVTADPDYGLYALFHSSQFGDPGNRSFYANERVDELLELGRLEADPEKRAAIYAEAQELIVEEAPWAFLIATMEVNGMRDNVEGFVAHPAGHHDLSTVYKK